MSKKAVAPNGSLLCSVNLTLAAATAAGIVAPGNYFRVFTGTDVVFVDCFKTATVAGSTRLPTNDAIIIGDGSFGASRLSFISAGTPTITIECYEI
jgi:hypothetical protein